VTFENYTDVHAALVKHTHTQIYIYIYIYIISLPQHQMSKTRKKENFGNITFLI